MLVALVRRVNRIDIITGAAAQVQTKGMDEDINKNDLKIDIFVTKLIVDFFNPQMEE